METLKGIFIILVHWALGMLCATLTGNFIPGSVYGMMLLFISLMLGIVKSQTVRPVADFLTKNMTVFFLPAAIGIMQEWDLVKLNLLGWLAVILISTIIVLLTTGILHDFLSSLTSKFRKDA